jgi:alpha-1,2-glucosyltransferase
MAHPFLLADNRHYPFYVWKNLFRRFAPAKYLFVPAYLVCATVMQRAWSGERAQSRLFQLLFWAVTALCLVPTPLLEPRYFLTPFLLWFLHSAPRLIESVLRSCAAVALYVAINAATLYVFLRRPFTWADGSEARFMW